MHLKISIKTLKQIDSDDFIMDILDPNPDFIYHKKFTLWNIMLEVFVPKDEIIITLIFESETIICRNKATFCFALLFHKNYLPYLFYLEHSDDKPRYFVKSDDKWAGIACEEFKFKLAALRNSVKIKELITIDGDQQYNHYNLIIDKKVTKSTNQVTCYPKIGYEATAVVARGKLIWKAEQYERCLLATIFYYKNEAVLAHLAIGDGRDTKKIFYKFNDDEWLESKKCEYINIARKCAPWFSRFEVVINAITDPVVT